MRWRPVSRCRRNENKKGLRRISQTHKTGLENAPQDYLHWVLPLRFVLFELFFALLVLSELRSWALLLLALQSREELVLLLALLEALLALFVLLEDLLLALRAFCVLFSIWSHLPC